MLSSLLFIITRLVQLIFLIPLLSMLAYFIHGFVAANLLTPTFILVLFIVSVLAAVWALATLLFFSSSKRSGYFLALVDLAFFAALIAGVVVLRGIAGADCGNGARFNSGVFGQQLAPFVYSPSKSCSILKASFAFGIICIILFFNSFILALLVHHHTRKNDRNHSNTRHYSRHSHRRRGSSRSGGSGGGHRSSSRYGPYDDRRRSSRGAGRSRSRSRSYV